MHALQEGMSSALLMVKDGPWPFSRSDAQGRQEGRKKNLKKMNIFLGDRPKSGFFFAVDAGRGYYERLPAPRPYNISRRGF